jgi:glycosyltransferase involved in cell wall biosynthesis
MPYPEVDGGCRAMAELSRGLYEQGVELHIAAIRTHKHQGKEVYTETGSPFAKPILPIDTDTKIKPAALLRNLVFSKQSYNLERFTSESTQEQCIKIVNSIKPDIVILDGFFCTPLLPGIRKSIDAKIVYRSHNVEWKLWESRAANSRGPVSYYFSKMARRLKREEESFAKMPDAFLYISEEEESFFRQINEGKPDLLLPFTVEVKKSRGNSMHGRVVFYHLGAMDWFPNVKGMQWFLKEVWPDFHRERPEARMLLAGKGMPREWRNPGLEVMGEIERPEDIIDKSDVLIAPVFSASGVRIKILEALGNGKVVITHTQGKQGLLEKQLKGVLTANTAMEYREAMKLLYDTPEKFLQLSKGAVSYVEEQHQRQNNYIALMRFLKGLTR